MARSIEKAVAPSTSQTYYLGICDFKFVDFGASQFDSVLVDYVCHSSAATEVKKGVAINNVSLAWVGPNEIRKSCTSTDYR